MKRIEAIIRTEKVDKIRVALDRIGARGMTTWEVYGHGRQKGHRAIYRGNEYDMEFVRKSVIVVFLSDDIVNSVVDAIFEIARTGDFGDGIVAISDVQELLKVRTRESVESTW